MPTGRGWATGAPHKARPVETLCCCCSARTWKHRLQLFPRSRSPGLTPYTRSWPWVFLLGPAVTRSACDGTVRGGWSSAPPARPRDYKSQERGGRSPVPPAACAERAWPGAAAGTGALAG